MFEPIQSGSQLPGQQASVIEKKVFDDVRQQVAIPRKNTNPPLSE